MQPVILASTSTYRRQVLEKLNLAFSVAAPDYKEDKHPDETPKARALRHAVGKARSLAPRFPQHLIIGSDQVACLGSNQILSKPGNRERAIEQLQASSGNKVEFQTGVCLLNTATGQIQQAVEPYCVHFRNLELKQIERYVDTDQPFDCAGSFKAEGYGISLFTAMEGEDPNSLTGLPLIRLIQFLNQEGVQIP